MNNKNFKVKKGGGVQTKNGNVKAKGTNVKRNYSRAPDKKDGEERINRYYWKLAQGVAAVKYVLAAGLVLIGVACFMLNSSEFSLENITYLFRYIDVQSAKKITVSEFSIEADEHSAVSFYRNNIAVVSSDRISIYDFTGRRNFTAPCVYSQPKVSVSDRYILAYDIGSYKMEVYNSFSKLYEYKGETPILMAKLNASGNIAYLTSQSEFGYHFALHIKNRDFTDFFVFKTNNYVSAFDISDNAGLLAVGAYTTRNGDFLTEISIFDTSEKEPRTKLEYPGVIPYYIKCHGNGFFVAFKDEIKFFGSDDKEINNYYLSDGIFQKIAFTDISASVGGDKKPRQNKNKAAIVLNCSSLGVENRILVFDESGLLLHEEIMNDDVVDIKFDESGENLYILTPLELKKIDIAEGSLSSVTEEIEKSSGRLLYADGEDVIIAGVEQIHMVKIK